MHFKTVSLCNFGILRYLIPHILSSYIFRLHLHIVSLKDKSLSSSDSVHCQRTPSKGDEVYVDKFGFGCDTSCGLIPMPNHWESNWIVSLLYT